MFACVTLHKTCDTLRCRICATGPSLNPQTQTARRGEYRVSCDERGLCLDNMANNGVSHPLFPHCICLTCVDCGCSHIDPTALTIRTTRHKRLHFDNLIEGRISPGSFAANNAAVAQRLCADGLVCVVCEVGGGGGEDSF